MTDHLQKFFSSYDGFTYDSSVPASQQFQQLRRHSQWEHDSPEGNEAWESFRDALVLDFNGIYGTNQDDIEAWHALCTVLGVEPIPDTVSACRTKIEGIYVNLVDLVDFANGAYGKKVVSLFPTEMALSKYTKASGKYFPRENVHAGGLLRYLLRHIINPRADSEGKKKKEIDSPPKTWGKRHQGAREQ